MGFTRKSFGATVLLAAAVALASCSNDGAPLSSTERGLSPASKKASASTAEASIMAMMGEVNAALDARGAGYRAEVAEYLTASVEIGRTVFFRNLGNKQLAHHFVPGDVRRGGLQEITYLTDQTDGAAPGLDLATSTAAIDRAMATWEDQSCSDLPIVKVSDLGIPHGVAAGQSGFVLADIAHAGWFPLGPGVLGVTITFLFCDPCGSAPVFTDVDGNGKLDTAFREIYYSTNFVWADDGVSHIDLETVALHEAGHGLSQAHFGTLSRTDKNGKFHFSPLAVMNAGYTQVQRSLAGTDGGGHCSIWGSYPNN